MSNKVIAWDIGLKNLSYCILQKSDTNNNDYPVEKHGYSIIDWEVINLYPEEKKPVCCGFTKTKKLCGKTAKMLLEEKFYCKTHSPDESKEIKNKKSKNKHPFEYAIRIKEELDKRPELSKVGNVIIENQPALVNPIMKTVQMIIFSYFAFKRTSENLVYVQNVNAKQKEKLPEKDREWENSKHHKDYLERIKNVSEKDKYTRRKKLCFYYAKQCLETAPGLQDFLETHKKQDDLTDSFLMCIDWLNRK